MRQRFTVTLSMLLIICLLSAAQAAAADLQAGVQLSYGSTNFSKLLGTDTLKAAQLLSNVWARYDHEDLRFTGLYQGSTGLGSKAMGRHLGQVAANYRFLKEGPMQIYGGIGYHFLSTSVHDQNRSFSLTGHGFAGQVVVDIELAPQFSATAALTTSPWVKWSYSSGGQQDNDIATRSSFNAKIDFVYDSSEQLSVQVGLLGGTFRVPSFSDKGETQASFTAINAGITQRF